MALSKNTLKISQGRNTCKASAVILRKLEKTAVIPDCGYARLMFGVVTQAIRDYCDFYYLKDKPVKRSRGFTAENTSIQSFHSARIYLRGDMPHAQHIDLDVEYVRMVMAKCGVMV